MRALLFVIVLAAAGYGAWHVWGGKEGSPAAGGGGPVMAVEAARVNPEKLVVNVNTVGNLRSNESVILRPEIAGRIENIAFDEGATVKKDAVLIQLDARLAESEVKQTEAQLKLARLSQNRARDLQKTGAVSQSRLDQATADLAVADANLGLARAKFDKTRIIAPFDGVVGLRRVSPGDVVSVGQELENFESYDPMKVDFSIPEVYAPLLKAGQELEISIDAIPGKPFTGSVYALDPQIEAGGRSIALRAKVPNPESTLKPGYFARINLVVDTKEAALLIPEAAIIPKGAETFVYAVEDGKAVTRKVTPGIRRDGRVEIVEGLKAGDVVITAGQMKPTMRDGMAVNAQVATESAPSAGEAE